MDAHTPNPEGEDLLPADLLPADVDSIGLRVRIHDSSRFEWQAVLPIPDSGRLLYEIEAEFEIPSNTLSGHSPWDLLQGFTRLDGDVKVGSSPDGSSNSLRHGVVALARMLNRARSGFYRHCSEMSESARTGAPSPAQEHLKTWLSAALRSVSATRGQLTVVVPGTSAEQSRERGLADEFISVRLLEFLADAQQVLATLEEKGLVTDPGAKEVLCVVDEQLAQALDVELTYRRAHGFAAADPELPETLEKYVERAGRLKKHFQEVLTLEREAYPLDDRVQQWVATFSALVAGMFMFGVQLVLGRWSFSGRLSSGLVVVIFIAGITYAARDRLKEIGRSWITGKVYRFHAQRVVKCRVAAVPGAKGDLVIQAQEWCNETTTARPDPLSPESGASMRATVVHHLHRGHLNASSTLIASGAQRVRQVFRYDLSPLFSRLHDPIKRVPVADVATRRARFIDAPRRYRLPVHFRVTADGQKHDADAVLVVDKQGIHRLEMSERAGALDLLPDR